MDTPFEPSILKWCGSCDLANANNTRRQPYLEQNSEASKERARAEQPSMRANKRRARLLEG